MRKVFLHIPKCGGNTVEAKLKCNNIPYTRIEPDTPIGSVPDGIVTGHFDFAKLEYDESAKFFTVMRTPLERAVSHYYYCFAKKDTNPEYPLIKDMSLEQFLDEYILDNYMCRFVIGHKWFDSEVSDVARFVECVSAINERYLAIGKIELINYFDRWLVKEFGGATVIAHDNRNAHDNSVSIEARLKFLKRNAVDYMLYEYVGNLWENPKFKK